MKNLIVFMCILIPSTLFAAGFKPSECKTMNWEQKGRSDGIEGQKIDVLYSYIKTCDKMNAPFSADLYRKGREEGLYTFCSNKNAYNMGFNKTKIHESICSAEMFPDFQKYYNNGLNFKAVDKKKIAVDKKIKTLSKTIAILEAAEKESKALQTELDKLEFKPEMSETIINKSTLMNTMSQPVMADPNLDTSLNNQKPIDFEYDRGDMEERQPANGKDPRIKN